MPSSSTNNNNARLVKGVITLVQKELRKAKKDASKVKSMQKYLKTDMPMYGIQRPERAIIEKKIYDYLASSNNNKEKNTADGTESSSTKISAELYQDCVRSLWALPHREEKYLAIDVAIKYRDHDIIRFDHDDPSSCCCLLELYESMLREDFMWWDLVDPIATNLIGYITYHKFDKMEPILRRWIRDDNMWIRRTAILSQLKSKEDTNEEMLFEFCRQRMHEKEFFIRKAIGWVLRQHSRINPNAVISFLNEEKASLSGLSFREGARLLVKQGLM